MKIVTWIIMIIMFLYTTGFSITLWKDKNNKGAIAIFVLAILIMVAPFFSLL